MSRPNSVSSSSNSSRRPSGVYVESQQTSRFAPRPSDAAPAPTGTPILAGANDAGLPPAHIHPTRYSLSADPQWNFPTYHQNYPSDYPGTNDPDTDSADAPRRGSGDSDKTLADQDDGIKDMTYSSYRHPYDIKPPPRAFGSLNVPVATKPSQEYVPKADTKNWDEELGQDRLHPAADRPAGLLSSLLQLHRLNSGDEWEREGVLPIDALRHRNPSMARPWGVRRIDSLASEEDQFIDPDDPTITGQRKAPTADPEDLEKNILRNMTYRERRKERQRVRIEFNVTSVANRQTFLTKLAQALMTFGAPSHRIESQLLSAARILEVDAEFIHIPGVIIASFGDHETKTTETHFVKCGGRLSLGSLHGVHQIYRKVVHDEISARRATEELETLITSPPIYTAWARCMLAFAISGLICPLAFGGSFLDMFIAGSGAVILCLMQISTAAKSILYQNVFEVSVTIVISFLARGLSSIPSQIFCYTAISSAGVVGILPGYLILTSSLELASKNVVCGSVKMVYALIYTLFLGFGLQIGSDLFLLFDHNARDDLTTSVSSNVQDAFTLTGKYWAENNTVMGNNSHFFPTTGYTSFTFTNVVPLVHEHLKVGCYRPPWFPWYLQPFPWWTQFIIVPLFSVMSSLGNLQPVTFDLFVMIVISCSSYAANKVANHFIFQRSDVVSAIGAFVVGAMGNIYSRKAGGTAFTVMVTGVLFLVPSGLSQAGGITAQGDGIEIGNAMVAVAVGITVGLFMSQAIVYTFGSKKNAAIFSF